MLNNIGRVGFIGNLNIMQIQPALPTHHGNTLSTTLMETDNKRKLKY